MDFRRILDQLKANLNVYGASNSLVFKFVKENWKRFT